MTTSQHFDHPIRSKQRVLGLDVLRGFALLGIALMNIEFFHRPMQGMNMGMEQGLQGIHADTAWLIFAFVQGKFWMLFSLLFGIGFAVLFERAGADQAAFSKMYIRRLLALLVTGVLHGALIWAGDILTIYALTAFLLFGFARRISAKWALILGVLLQCAMPLFNYLGALAGMAMRMGLEEGDAGGMASYQQDTLDMYAQGAEIYAHGDWLAVTGQRVSDFAELLGLAPLMGVGVLGMFLIGVWAWRSDVFHHPQAHRKTHFKCLLGAVLGAVLAVCAMNMGLATDNALDLTWSYAHTSSLMWFASLLLCMGYASFAMLYLTKLGWLTQGLAALGRMALTNYLLQSVIFTTIMYGYAFGQFGKWQRLELVGWVFAVFFAQMLASMLWLRVARFGPMEWLWRWVSYGKKPVLWRASQTV